MKGLSAVHRQGLMSIDSSETVYRPSLYTEPLEATFFLMESEGTSIDKVPFQSLLSSEEISESEGSYIDKKHFSL